MRRVAGILWCVGVIALCVGGCPAADGGRSGVPIGVGDRGATAIESAAGVGLTIEPDSRGFDPATGRFDIVGAIGETVTFDLRVGVSGDGFNALDVHVGAVAAADGAQPGADFEVFRLHGVSVKRLPGWRVRFIPPARRPSVIDDVVVPRSARVGGLPARVAAGESLRVLAELAIPGDAASGVYHSSIVVVDDRRTLIEIPLQLTIWPFALPNPTSVALLAPVDVAAVRTDGGDASLVHVDRLLRSHGVFPVLSNVYPVVKVDREARVHVDWTEFDRTVGPYLDDRRGAWCRVPFDETFPSGSVRTQGSDPMTTRIASAYLRACATHFASHGWLGRSYLRIAIRKGDDATAVNAVRFRGGLARLADRRLRTLVCFDRHPLGGIGWPTLVAAGVDKFIDIWCPPARHEGRPMAPAPSEVWMGMDRPPASGSVAFAGEEAMARVLPWQALRYGMRGVLLGDATPASHDARRATSGAIGVLYSGAPFGLSEPVASMRLKHVRRGMQDLAYLELLDALGRQNVTTRLLDAVAPYALAHAYGYHGGDARGIGWAMDGAPWALARRIMAAEVMATDDGRDEGQNAPALDRVSLWRRLTEATRRLTMTVQGVRVRSDWPTGQMRVECLVSLENRTEKSVGGRLSFGKLPMGWRGSAVATTVAPIPPMGRGRAVLTATTKNLAWDTTGATEVPIVFRTDGQQVFTVPAKVCYIASQRCSKPMTVDGDLSDWPTGSGNTASGFVPISGAGSGLIERLPVTRCQVSHDDARLYVGIQCDGARPNTGDTSSHHNFVRYEDMIPMDEDLVEILIDPTNAGTYAPEDLYHIVITRGGAVFERGIDTQPPVGPRRVWAADVRYATRATPDGWTIELSVPFDAFEDSEREGRVWGFNVTRFDHATQIYGSWSGARYNAYLPVSLGNLMWP